jgi:hypothetical protein
MHNGVLTTGSPAVTSPLLGRFRSTKYASTLDTSPTDGVPPWMADIKDTVEDLVDDDALVEDPAGDEVRHAEYVGSLPGNTGGIAWHFFQYTAIGGVKLLVIKTLGPSGILAGFERIDLAVSGSNIYNGQLAWNDDQVRVIHNKDMRRITGSSGWTDGSQVRFMADRTYWSGGGDFDYGWGILRDSGAWYDRSGVSTPNDVEPWRYSAVAINTTDPATSAGYWVWKSAVPQTISLVGGSISASTVYPWAITKHHSEVETIDHGDAVTIKDYYDEDLDEWVEESRTEVPQLTHRYKMSFCRSQLTGKNPERIAGIPANSPAEFATVQRYEQSGDNFFLGLDYFDLYHYHDSGNHWVATYTKEEQSLTVTAVSPTTTTPGDGYRYRTSGFVTPARSDIAESYWLAVDGTSRAAYAATTVASPSGVGWFAANTRVKSLVADGDRWVYDSSDVAPDLPVYYFEISEVFGFHGNIAGTTAAAVVIQQWRTDFTGVSGTPPTSAAIGGADLLFLSAAAEIVHVVRSTGLIGTNLLDSDEEILRALGVSDRYLYLQAYDPDASDASTRPGRRGVRVGRDGEAVRLIETSWRPPGTVLPLEREYNHPIRESRSSHQTSVPFSDSLGTITAGDGPIAAAEAAFVAWL